MYVKKMLGVGVGFLVGSALGLLVGLYFGNERAVVCGYAVGSIVGVIGSNLCFKWFGGRATVAEDVANEDKPDE